MVIMILTNQIVWKFVLNSENNSKSYFSTQVKEVLLNFATVLAPLPLEALYQDAGAARPFAVNASSLSGLPHVMNRERGGGLKHSICLR